MKSPFTGKEMVRRFAETTWNFRNEAFPCIKEYWECVDTGERFTTTEGDQKCFIQATNQYRVAHGIPFADEIIDLRNRYKLSSAKMAKILGIGYNQYRGYESGEVPSESNGKLIRSAFNPKVMLDMINASAEIMTESSTKEIIAHINHIISKSDEYKLQEYDVRRIFSSTRSLTNGYAGLSIEKLKNLLLFILQKNTNVWITKMNKLLFYIDFASYRNYGYAISGLHYIALEYGPVPDNWARIYSNFDEIQQLPNKETAYSGHLLKAQASPDESLFSDKELDVMNYVCDKLGDLSATRLSELSHQEDAWIKSHDTHMKDILFSDAYTLKAI